MIRERRFAVNHAECITFVAEAAGNKSLYKCVAKCTVVLKHGALELTLAIESRLLESGFTCLTCLATVRLPKVSALYVSLCVSRCDVNMFNGMLVISGWSFRITQHKSLFIR